MTAQAGQEIAELKERLVAETSKQETAEKLSSKFQESLLKVTDNFEKAKTDFVELEENLTRRAEEAKAKLGLVEEELNMLKSYVSQLCVATFGKSSFCEIVT